MADYSIDITYAYTQLGLAPGAPFERVQEVQANAMAYRFSTRARTEEIQRFVDFFIARNRFGKPETPFLEIRAVYHMQAKAFHPDNNTGSKRAEERLKDVNAAYEIVDKIHREARAYFRKDEATRQGIEKLAREALLREAGARGAAPRQTTGQGPRTAQQWPQWPPASSAASSSYKYMAASVPRYIRMARLFYLPRHSIIGSRYVRYNAGKAMVYDVIMLPEREFMRARLSLGIEGQGSPELTMSRLTPAYIPVDTRMVFVPETEESPYLFARNYFIEKFNLTSVAA